MSTTMDPVLANQIRTFAIFLSDLADGRVHSELTEGLRDLVMTMMESASTNGGKSSGSISLNLGLKYDRGAFIPNAEVKVKKPKTSYPLSIFWPTADGMLSRQDPRQQNLPLREVKEPEVRVVG